MENFVHLHVHTEYSLLDGATKIEELVATCKERGCPAVALTDHGNMYGAINFFETCLKYEIKPIIGCEFYICHNLNKKEGKADIGHLILLAKNEVGYKNLLKLNSIAFLRGFYYKPRIDYDVLKEHCEGLICLSACLAGHIPQLLLQRRFDEAEELALKMRDMFGDDFYLEIQNHGLAEQIEVLEHLEKLSKKTGIKLVATNDVHYLRKEDAEAQDVLLCVQMNKQIDDPDRMKFETQEFYLKNYEEMKQALNGYENALATTLEIAKKCDLVIKSKSHGDIKGVDKKYVLAANENFIPLYSVEGMTTYEFLRKLTFDGLKQIYGDYDQTIKDRAEMELQIIYEQGFVEYFLVVWDYVNFAKSQGIPVGPGRGSGAGSIVAYAIGITMVDPMKYSLLFERFINKERISMPDFDIDFCPVRAPEVVEYVKKKYGEDHVAMIITFGTMAAKNALRDVARVMRMPLAQVDKLTKQIPLKLPDGIKKPPVLKYYFGTTGKAENDKLIIPDLRRAYDEDDFVKRVVDLAIKLEGTPRNTSVHAAGVLIAPRPVDDFVPLAKNVDDVTTQYNMIELEHLGLLKMDFLKLKTLTDIDDAVKNVKKNKGIEIDFYNMEYDDPNVYNLISTGSTEAIFQLEGGGMQKFMKDLKPDCLEDIIAGVALYRPGPMDSIPRYIDGKRNPSNIIYEHPCLEPILNVTYGCIVYQEQVMQIFQVMGGYTFAQADNVRRIMSKKKKELMPIERQKFIFGDSESGIPGAIKLGISQEVAEKVFGEMESFASYAFNKSHAAAYAYLTYQTAYLKCYHEVEFITAVINNRITNLDEIKKYVLYAKKENIEVLPPDINHSYSVFKVEDGKIRFGLGGLKNVGVGVIDSIINEREKNGKFLDFMDFVSRVDALALNKRCLESLILSGAFDCFGKYRSQLMNVFDLAVERTMRDRKSKATGQFSLFDVDTSMKKYDDLDYPNIKEFNKATKLKHEKEVVGIYISGHPLDDYMDRFSGFTLTSDMLFKSDDEMLEEDGINQEESFGFEDGSSFTCGGIITEITRKTTKSNREMAFLKIEDLMGVMEIMLFPNVYTRYKNFLEEDKMVSINGRFSIKDDGVTLIAENIKFWEKEDEAPKETKAHGAICVIFDTDNEMLKKEVLSLTGEYVGEDELFFKSKTTKKSFKCSKTTKINTNLINDLIGLLGEENLIVKEGL